MHLPTFYAGEDERFPDLEFKGILKTEAVPNTYAKRGLLADERDPKAWKFALQSNYRQQLIAEFAEDKDGSFVSRYKLQAPCLPPPPRFRHPWEEDESDPE